jgi:fatty-acyl-CoA synthase
VPDAPAVIDELGTLTFRDVHRRTNALANALRNNGLGAGDNVGVMCRNHRGFVEATIALSKLGAHSLYLNTAFAGPQLADVAKREGASVLIYDEEFTDLLAEAGKKRQRFIAWHDQTKPSDPTLDELIAAGSPADPRPPEQSGRVVILTSGTTGTPKGAGRSSPATLDPAVAILSRIPLHFRDRMLIAAPLFHSWGMAHFQLGLLLFSSYILQRRFDPEATLAAIERHDADVLAVVPVMMQRILDLPEKTRRKYDTSSLRVVAVSGSALLGELANRFMDEFGDIVYNLYGSTEVSWATIATPEDLRAAPGTAGKPPRGTVVRIVDENGNILPPGQVGRIFVSNEFLFEGYTGGGSKAVIEGMMSTGDVGRFDDEGRLFVEGRDDEMIVSGGENVFPREVEDLIADMDGVREVAVVGVVDQEFGQRLRAFVVRNNGDKPGEEDVKAQVRSSLARFKVPREVIFLDELPRNATGKVLKRELTARE